MRGRLGVDGHSFATILEIFLTCQMSHVRVVELVLSLPNLEGAMLLALDQGQLA